MNFIQRRGRYFVTSEWLTYAQLMEPKVVGLLKKHRFGLCLCIRAEKLDEELDRLCRIYHRAGIPLIFWPLLPMKEGLYLNKYSVTEYYNYLDVIFDWIESRRQRVAGLLVDVEPDYQKPDPKSAFPLIDNIWHSLRDLDEAAFNASIAGFKKIIAKIRKHDCQAIGAAMPFVCEDRPRQGQAWQDYWGGPVASVEWDSIVFMLFGSWFVQMGMNWPTAHYLIYEYAQTIKKFWRHKAVAALGVTTAGTGGETALYRSPVQITGAVAAVRAAGVHNIGVYDLKGILESADPGAWFAAVRNTPPLVPGAGKPGHTTEPEPVEPLKLKLYHLAVDFLGMMIQIIRSLKRFRKECLWTMADMGAAVRDHAVKKARPGVNRD
jgi:hypothetical protein